MHLRRSIFILSSILLLASPCMAGIKVTVHPTGGDADQKVINEAFEKVAKFGGGEVYLEAEGGNNVFTVTGTCKFLSDHTKLTGDSNTILSVSPESSQWFTGTNTIIYSNGYSDIEISGFQIDGNCEKLPFDYHHSRSDTAHDCERAILISGSSGNFCSDVSIHDMQVYDCLSDGIHTRFADKVHVYNNFISNTQHECIFFVSVKNGLIEGNKAAGITSDCIRLDNVVNNIVQNNYCYSYTGTHNSKAPKGHQNGIQIANAGSSHGYDASKKPTSTTNVEVRWNHFVNTGDRAVWLDSTGKGYDNVYVHDNNFTDVKSFTNDGEPVSITGVDPSKPISYENPPSKETSEKVFSSIFDIFRKDFYYRAGKNDTVILPDGVKTPTKVTGTIEYQKVGSNYTTYIFVHPEGLTQIQYYVNGKSATQTLMIGEKTSKGIEFFNVSEWSGELKHQGDSLKLDGKVSEKYIKVICTTPYGELEPSFSIKDSKLQAPHLNKGVIFTIILLFLIGSYLKKILRNL